jgi:hypothetical protein
MVAPSMRQLQCAGAHRFEKACRFGSGRFGRKREISITSLNGQLRTVAESLSALRFPCQNSASTSPAALLLLLGNRWSRRRGQRLDWLRFNALQHRSRPALPALIHRQRDRRDHEQDGRPGGGLRKSAGRAARAKCGLAALSAEGRGEIAGAAALQQHDDDDEEASQNVYGSDEINHNFVSIGPTPRETYGRRAFDTRAHSSNEAVRSR